MNGAGRTGFAPSAHEPSPLRIALIRHAPTQGNLEGRYVGATDEGLSDQGRARAGEAAAVLAGLAPRRLFTSGMRRCDETAAILFPELAPTRLPGLAEMHFGAFEGKTYAEMDGDARYQAWVDSGCTAACPGGEAQAEFVTRVCAAFEQALDDLAGVQAGSGNQGLQGSGRHVGLAIPDTHRDARDVGAIDAAFLVHAGTIMAAMSELAEPKRGYWEWKATYCAGFETCARHAENGWRLTDVREPPRRMEYHGA